MISIERRINLFIRLGEWLKGYNSSTLSTGVDSYTSLAESISKAHTYNSWLIEKFVKQSIEYWSLKLSKEALIELPQRYHGIDLAHAALDIAVIPQENIPLAGFHDFISVILTGNRFYCRNVNHDCDLLQVVTMKLIEFEPELKEYIIWCDIFPKQIDAYLIYKKSYKVDAINQYFNDKYNLIRNKRVSVGLLLESDTTENFEKLSSDIFSYFGHSYRNVRKLYVPEGFTVDSFYPSLEEYYFVYKHNRYANNFDYHRSVFLLDRIPFFENGFLIMRDSSELIAPIGCIYFEYYKSKFDLETKLKRDEPALQQVVTNADFIRNSVKFGEGHQYSLYDFDDHKDVIFYLLNINNII